VLNDDDDGVFQGWFFYALSVSEEVPLSVFIFIFIFIF